MATYDKNGKVISGVDWDYYDKFDNIIETYVPDRGEGETIASQIATAINKLVYKWYNDGDVFDNTRYLRGWANDLSSYANWLDKYLGTFTKCSLILEKVWRCKTEEEYEFLLKELADSCLDENLLEAMSIFEKSGSIYECEGRFEFNEYYDDDEDEWYEDDEEDEYYDDDEEEAE